MRKVLNAYTLLFDNNDRLANKYGYHRVQQKFDSLLRNAPIDAYQDQPLPTWALKILESGMLGYRDRIRLVFLHDMCIEGKHIKSPLARLNDDAEDPPCVEGNLWDWLHSLKEKKVLTNNEGIITCL